MADYHFNCQLIEEIHNRKRTKTLEDIFMDKDTKVQDHRNQLLEALTLGSLAKKSSGFDERKMTSQAKWLLGYEEAGEHEIKIRPQINEVVEKMYEEIKRQALQSLW